MNFKIWQKLIKPKIKISIILLIVISFCFGYISQSGKSIQADTSQSSKAQVSKKHTSKGYNTQSFIVNITSNGFPQKNYMGYIVSYQKAYEKIKNGNFSDEDIKSSAWIAASGGNTTSGGNTASGGNTTKISIASTGLYIGRSQIHTDEETSAIIKSMFSNELSLLQFLNDTPGAALTSHPLPKNVFQMYRKGNGALPLSAKNGDLFASEIPLGYAIVINSLGTYVSHIVINSLTKKININLGQPYQGVAVVIKGVPEDTKNKDTYVLDNQESYTYEIKIASSIIDENTTVQIFVPKNIVISNLSNLYDGVPTPDGKNIVYKVFLSSSQKKDTTIIKWDNKGNVILNLYANLDLDNFSTSLYTQKEYLTGYRINVLVQNKFESLTSASPNTSTGGINFVEMDTNKNVLVTGASYLLGKKINSKIYYYIPKYGWKKDSEVKQEDLKFGAILTGGRRYFFQSHYTKLHRDYPIPLPLSTSLANYNQKQSTKINKSLIQIVGLRPGQNYFLKEISTPAGYKIQKNVIPFKISYERYYSPNDSLIIQDSASNAVNPSYKVDGQIPDFAAGYNEYNVLSVTSRSSVRFNSFFSIILPIILAFIVVLSIGYFLIVKRY